MYVRTLTAALQFGCYILVQCCGGAAVYRYPGACYCTILYLPQHYCQEDELWRPGTPGHGRLDLSSFLPQLSGALHFFINGSQMRYTRGAVRNRPDHLFKTAEAEKGRKIS